MRFKVKCALESWKTGELHSLAFAGSIYAATQMSYVETLKEDKENWRAISKSLDTLRWALIHHISALVITLPVVLITFREEAMGSNYAWLKSRRVFEAVNTVGEEGTTES